MPDNLLLKLTPAEEQDLINQIRRDYDDAVSAHAERMQRYRDYVARFYNTPDAKGNAPSKSSLIQEQVLTKLAREYTSIFGQGAEVVADPRGEQDARTSAKVGAMLTYKFLAAMKPQRQVLQFMFQRNLLGRAIAYMPYEVKTFATLDDAGNPTQAQYYRGPGFYTLAADDFITPPMKYVQSLQDFPWVIHQYRMPYAKLISGIKAGKFYPLSDEEKNRLKSAADGQSEQSVDHETVGPVEALAEGVIYGMTSGKPGRGRLKVHAYYGYMDTDEEDQEEIVARIEPETQTLLSVQRLIDIYPNMAKRRPFVEGALMPIGGYWSMGLAQMLTADETELSENMKLFRLGGEASIFPPLAIDPSSGIKADSLRLEPGMAFECKNASGIKQIDVRFDPNYTVLNEQMTRASVERRTGISDYIQGRDAQRPTAPDTASGQAMLMQAGNERLSLDTSILGLDMADILERVFLLESSLGDPNEWFRVTEQKASDIVGVRNGRFQMTEAERHGFYDFTLRLASGPQEKELRRQRVITLYELSMANPLIAMNPLALWNITAKVYRELTGENFAEIIPKPPDPGFSAPPTEEWTKMLQGQEVSVHPMDDDARHIEQHMLDAEEHLQGKDVDEKAVALLQAHIAEHVKQQNQKRLMQAMVEGVVRSLAGNNQQTGGLTFKPPVAIPVQQLGEQMQGMISPPVEQPGQAQPGAMPQ